MNDAQDGKKNNYFKMAVKIDTISTIIIVFSPIDASLSKVKERQWPGINAIKPHIPPQNQKGKEAHTQIDGHSRTHAR